MALELQRADDPCPLWRPSGLHVPATSPATSPVTSPVAGGHGLAGAGGGGGAGGRGYVEAGAEGLMIRPLHPEARDERRRLCDRFRSAHTASARTHTKGPPLHPNRPSPPPPARPPP